MNVWKRNVQMKLKKPFYLYCNVSLDVRIHLCIDIESWMKNDDQYEINDQEIVTFINQDQAPIVESVRVLHNDECRSQ